MHSKLWQSYQAGNQTARDRLLEEHLGLVHHVARQVSRTLAVRADFDELVSAGTIGLMTALESFDFSRGLAFSTFAAPRIRGAILDELRKQDHVPRSIRRKTRDMSAGREAFQRTHGRAPDHQELAQQLNVDMDTLWRWQADVEGAHHIALDRAPGERENTVPVPAETLSSDSDVEDSLTHEQEVSHLKDAIMHLKEQERVVLSLYYFEELKLHEIAKVLELTESRVSQIRSKALSKLRVELTPLRGNVA
ncbi:sigma-70 family RNA polymerase sigma factor [Gemmatimonas sp.]|uniref:sigma-70 family RNA polymerase sigma factor n=1 Tax=Gemmatimonas sp. TaxID=1962908 RepID=UPI00356224FB